MLKMIEEMCNKTLHYIQKLLKLMQVVLSKQHTYTVYSTAQNRIYKLVQSTKILCPLTLKINN